MLIALKTAVRSEIALIFGAATTILFYVFSDALLAGFAPNLKTVGLFLWPRIRPAAATVSA